MTANALRLRRAAWFGDEPVELDLPATWTVEVTQAGNRPAISADALTKALSEPLGAPALEELAARHERAAIVVDDITRPTPTGALLRPVLAKLEAGGIPRSAVTIFVAAGTHDKASPEDVAKKLSPPLASELRVVTHDMTRPDLLDLGRSSRGTPIAVSPEVMECDLKLGIGGINVHPAAGFSGGSKILVPGICGLATAAHLHKYLSGERGSFDTPFRRDTDEIAERIGLGFVVNVVLNRDREVAGAFAGHPVAAFREGARFANEIYRARFPGPADVVVADAYPYDTALTFASDRAFWPLLEAPRRATKVVIASCPMGPQRHQLALSVGRNLAALRPGELRFLARRLRNLRRQVARRRLDFLMLSDGLAQADLAEEFPRGVVYASWDALRDELVRRHPDPHTRVAFYRNASLLLPDQRDARP